MSAPPVIDVPGAPPSLAPPIRLGCVSFLNTLPLIEGLGKLADARLTLTAPARLIDLLVQNQVDMGLLSVIDYQRSPEPLVLLPVGMIGCDGPTLTVRLFSSVPIEKLTRVHADIDSHTSVALLRVILAERFGLAPEIVDLDVDAHRATHAPWPEAMLVIGDKVVTDAPPAVRYPHQLDLGQEWKALTGLAFVYATWMCREADVERVRPMAAMLDRQRRHNATRTDWIVHNRATVRGWPEDLAAHYFKDLLRFDVKDQHRAAVDRFFDLAQRHGVITARRPTRWADV
jgi:chorismate dehydratase